jgi:hypothetical protein
MSTKVRAGWPLARPFPLSDQVQKSRGHRGETAAPNKRRQLRGRWGTGADGLNPSNSGLRVAFPAQNVPSITRFAAGAFGFLTFRQAFDGPDL